MNRPGKKILQAWRKATHARAVAGLLTVLATLALGPQPGRSQAMVRGEPALSSQESGSPTVTVNGHPNPTGDETVRQPQAAVLHSGDVDDTGNVIDLTDEHGAVTLLQGMKWRPIFYLTLGVAYNDNVFVSRQKDGDFISTIQPGIILAYGDYRTAVPHRGNAPHVYDTPVDQVGLGRFIYFDYHPTVFLFAKNSSENTVDESANLLAGYTFTKLTLGGQAQYQKLSGDNLDLGGRVDRDLYTGNLSSLYTYDDKTSWEINFYGYDREYSAPYISSSELETRDFLNYQYGAKTTLSAGIAAGYIDYRTSTNQAYQQVLLRVTRQEFAKLDFTVTGGVEYRETSGYGNRADGVFDLAATYHYSDTTTFSITGTRDTEPSGLRNEDINYTRVNVDVAQQLFARIELTLNVAYANAKYDSIATSSNFSRTDNTEEVGLTLDTDITRYATLQVNYVFRNNTSNLSQRTFTESIGGVQVRFTY